MEYKSRVIVSCKELKKDSTEGGVIGADPVCLRDRVNGPLWALCDNKRPDGRTTTTGDEKGAGGQHCFLVMRKDEMRL